jgi:aryl-alcohol dehydrogenase-like predicted oxidoreductase
MRYSRLGESGLIVSRIALGCLTFGAKPGSPIYKVDGPEADRIVGRALDHGVNFFDTSDLYAGGASEALLGAALKGRREHAIITSKAGFRVGDGVTDACLSRRHLMRAIDGTLARLGTDHVDLYLVHKEDPLTPLDETLRALDDIVRSGKARYIGFSNWSAWLAAIALERQRHMGLAPFVSGQVAYSLVQRDAEYDLLPFMERFGVGATAWSPLAGGFLTGKYDRQSANDPATRAGISTLPFDREQGFAIIDVLGTIAGERGRSVAEVAIAWTLMRPVVTAALIGVSRLDQLDSAIAAADLVLDEADLARLEAVAAIRPLYPHWHIASSHDRRAFAAIGRTPPTTAGGGGRGDIAGLAASAPITIDAHQRR